MSEANTISLIAYILGLLPGMYFAYKLIREVIYYLKRDDEDITGNS